MGREPQQGRQPSLRRLRVALALPWSAPGRSKLAASVRFRSWPLLFPIASAYRRTLLRHARVVAVVGSFGKTTATRAVAAALAESTSEPRGWNAGGFLAEALLRARPWKREPIVVEVGIKRPGQMGRYARLLCPDIVVVTSIGAEHHRTLGTLEDIRQEKSAMLRQLGTSGAAILNGDDPHVRWMASTTQAQITTFGFGDANDVRAMDYVPCGLAGGEFVLRAAGATFRVRTRLVGRHMVYPLLAAAAAALCVGRRLEDVIPALETLPPTEHRLEPLLSEAGPQILLDDYKSVYETIAPALAVLSDAHARRRVVVLGEIYEPLEAFDAYREAGMQLARVADRVVFVGPRADFDRLRAGAAASPLELEDASGDAHRAADIVREGLSTEDLVLVKSLGSQRLERTALLLAGRTVRCRIGRCPAPVTFACASCPNLSREPPRTRSSPASAPRER